MNVAHSPLDDPETAAHVWQHYRRIMRIMGWVTLAVVVVAVAVIYWQNGLVSINLYIATVLGVGGTMLLATALMGLVFLSSGTGHDDSVVDPFADAD